MRSLAMYLVSGLFACAPAEPTCVTAVAVSKFNRLMPPIALQATVVEVPLLLNLRHCVAGNRDLPAPIEVLTEVLSPSNRAIAHSNSRSTPVEPLPFQNGGVTTTVRFPAMTSGDYHVRARFEPSFGIVQERLTVAQDRTNAIVKTLSWSKTCESLEVLPNGLTLCLDHDELSIFSNDKKLQNFDADDFAVAGNVVWTARMGVVRRWVSSLEGLSQSPIGHVETMITGSPTLVATEDVMILVAAPSAVRVRTTVDGLGLNADSSVTFPLQGSVSVLPHFEMNTVVVAGRSNNVQHGEAAEICRLFFNAYRPPSCASMHRKDCVPVGAEGVKHCFIDDTWVLGSDKSALWLGSKSGVRAVRFGESSEELLETAAEFSGQIQTQLRFSSHYPGVSPIDTGPEPTHFVLSLGPEGIAVSHYFVPPGFVLMPGSATQVRAQHPDGRQLLFLH